MSHESEIYRLVQVTTKTAAKAQGPGAAATIENLVRKMNEKCGGQDIALVHAPTYVS